MQYRRFGTDNQFVSALGFGTMRLKEYERGGRFFVDIEHTKDIIRLAYENGITYFDCGYGYCHQNSEKAVGIAVNPFRKNILLSAKLPMWDVKTAADFDRIFAEQLENFQTDYIDYYHFHALNRNYWRNVVLKFGLLDKMMQYKKRGAIRHIAFSFHDNFDTFKEIADADIFSSCLLQYNLIDRSNAPAIDYAARKGMGVVVMGPLGGGRLAKPNERLDKFLIKEKETLPHLALIFALSNPDISCVISGMETNEIVNDNVNVTNNFSPFTKERYERILSVSEELESMAKLYCTGCKYCMPCPSGINIPHMFSIMNAHLVYGFTEHAKEQYRQFSGKKSSDCSKCGKCMKLCPQNIDIIGQMKRIVAELG